MVACHSKKIPAFLKRGQKSFSGSEFGPDLTFLVLAFAEIRFIARFAELTFAAYGVAVAHHGKDIGIIVGGITALGSGHKAVVFRIGIAQHIPRLVGVGRRIGSYGINGAYIVKVIREGLSPSQLPADTVLLADGKIKTDSRRNNELEFAVSNALCFKRAKRCPGTFTVQLPFRVLVYASNASKNISTEIIAVAICSADIIHLVKEKFSIHGQFKKIVAEVQVAAVTSRVGRKFIGTGDTAIGEPAFNGNIRMYFVTCKSI